MLEVSARPDLLTRDGTVNRSITTHALTTEFSSALYPFRGKFILLCIIWSTSRITHTVPILYSSPFCFCALRVIPVQNQPSPIPTSTPRFTSDTLSGGGDIWSWNPSGTVMPIISSPSASSSSLSMIDNRSTGLPIWCRHLTVPSFLFRCFFSSEHLSTFSCANFCNC